MSATIITLDGALATPTGIKVKTDLLDLPQTLLIHDFSKPATWPSQASTVPSNTKFANLATQSAIAAKGFVASANGFAYSSANKSIAFNGSAGGASNWLSFQGFTAPYEHLPVDGLQTDVLIILWIKMTSVAGLVFNQYNNGTSLTNVQFSLPVSSSTFLPYALGGSAGSYSPAPTAGNWMQVGFYVRANNYNGKAGLQKHFLNNVVAANAAISATSFFAEDTTKPLQIGTQFGGWFGELGRIAVVKGLDAAGLTPEELVAADWAANRSKWS